MALALLAMAQRGTTVRVSVSSSGGQGNGESSSASISADGRFVAFRSNSTNLVPGDTNGYPDVFVHDRQTGQTTRVSVSSTGEQGNDMSFHPSISADGRFVSFSSWASNLVAGDTNNTEDVFVHDRQTGQTTRVSVSSTGQQGNGSSHEPSINADGRFVAFMSHASNLVAGDTNNRPDIFVHDRQTGQTTRVSVSSAGEQGNGDSGSYSSISADGRFVSFSSLASNLVPGDTNGRQDVFVHDRQTGQTTRVSVSSAGEQGISYSRYPSISADGRFVAFESHAWNLVPGDTNNREDVFVHDRQTGQTTRVSVSSTGQQGNNHSHEPSISADSRFVSFSSWASNLVAGDTNNTEDVFVHDRQTGQTTRVSVSSAGEQGNDHSFTSSISADGRFVSFSSLASNLVPGDTNNTRDVFVHQYGSGGGGGGGNQGGGNTGGDPPLRDRRNPRDPSRPVPIVLVHGLETDEWFRQFLGGGAGHLQWNQFKANFVAAYQSRGFSVYHPATNPNGNIFIVENLNTYFGVGFNAELLNTYLQGIANAPAMRSAAEFDIVGFSMGGFIARRWEQVYDNPNTGTAYSAQTKRVGNIVTIATPHAGSFLADLLLATGLIVFPSVLDLTSAGTVVFNWRNPGLPGARYSRIAADLDRVWPLSGHDGVVAGYSALTDYWRATGYQGLTFTLRRYAHVNASWLGLSRVLDGMPAVEATYQSIYGAGPGDSEDTLAPNERVALMEPTRLGRGALIWRDVPISADASEAGFQASWAEGSASVTLVEPGGRVIDPAEAKRDPNIEHFAYPRTAGYSVNKPVAGVWRIRVQGGADIPKGGADIPKGGTDCDLTVTDDAPCDAVASTPRLVRLNGRQGRFLMELRLLGGARLVGGSASGVLIKPDFSRSPITLYDDGKHGDGGAGDGLFGSDLVTGKAPGTYTAAGHISGALPGFGGAQRWFTTSFTASPETGRIQALQGWRPVDDPNDPDTYFDILNADIRLQLNSAGTYTLSGDLHDPAGFVIDAVSKVFQVSQSGPQVVSLQFRGAVIGEHDKDGPYELRNVTLTHETEPPMPTDFVERLGKTAAYSRLEFETIHPRTVPEPGRIRSSGKNLISLPLTPLPKYSVLADILGGDAKIEIGGQMVPATDVLLSQLRRGYGYWIQFDGEMPDVIAYLGTADDHEYEVLLPSAGFYRLGTPYSVPLPLSRILLRNESTGQYRTAEQDANHASPWLKWEWEYYEDNVPKRLSLIGGHDDHLRPWTGYVVQSHIPNLVVIFRD